MTDIQYAFITEYGNYGFDFEDSNISTHFLIVSILVKESNKARLEQEVESIRQKYFQHAGMGHEGRIPDHDLKIQLLTDLSNLPFHIYAHVIDKRKVRDDNGITFKNTFFKYVNRIVYDDLSHTFEQLDMVAAEQEYMQAFKKYVNSTSIPDLFHYSLLGFNQSYSEILLQLADFIAGILAQGYNNNRYSEHYGSFYKIIKSKIIAINLWPQDYKNFLFEYQGSSPDSKYDEVIIKQSVNLSYQYIEKNRSSEEPDEKIRIDFLKFLLYNLKENPNDYVYTQEILDNLNAIRELKINHHYFRSNIVSKLRDRGLLIASSNKGYKLPVCLADLYDFVNLSSLTIHPMIQRIAKCRDQILLATRHEIDILNQKEYEYLKKVIEMEKLSL